MLGRGLILLASGFALWSAAVSMRGRDPALVSSARRAALASFTALLLALALLWVAFFRRDFSIAYVAQQTTTRTSALYTFAGLWGGMAGSLLLWSAMLAGYGAMVARKVGSREGEIVLAVVGLATAFFALLTGLAADPFAPAAVVALEGRGLNPLLHSWGMAVHPLLLYLGWTGTTVVFGWAIAGVITRTPWVTIARRWTLFSWLALGLGLVVGGAWAYTELGWGGVWGWDPVENAPLLSFLALTALLHSQQVEEGAGLLRTWNASLAAIAFLLAILGTFLTRSGSLYSIHAFGQSSVAWWFLAFLAAAAVSAVGIIGWRSAELRRTGRLEAALSREVIFLLNNLLLLTVVLTMLLGSNLMPALSQAFGGRRIVMGAPYYNRALNPIFVALVVLSALGVATPWRRGRLRRIAPRMLPPALAATAVAGIAALAIRSTLFLGALWVASFVAAYHASLYVRDAAALGRVKGIGTLRALPGLLRRNPRRYGGYLVHVGMAVILLGFAGNILDAQTEVTLRPGEHTTFAGRRITYVGLREVRLADRDVLRAYLRVGEPGRLTKAEIQIHPGWENQPRGRPAIIPSPAGDLYAFLRSFEPSGQASFQLFWNPVVGWIWVGTVVALLGGVVCLGRDRRERPTARETPRAAEPVHA